MHQLAKKEERQYWHMSINSAFRMNEFFTSSTLYGGRHWPPNVKTQTQNSILKVDIQSEKSKSNRKSQILTTLSRNIQCEIVY